MRCCPRTLSASPLLGLVALVTASAGCGSAALRAAERGDAVTLRAEIADKHGRGKLSNDEAADLARAVAEREISTAKDEGTALARLRETRACAAELDGVLGDRMKKRDGPGAEPRSNGWRTRSSATATRARGSMTGTIAGARSARERSTVTRIASDGRRR